MAPSLVGAPASGANQNWAFARSYQSGKLRTHTMLLPSGDQEGRAASSRTNVGSACAAGETTT